MFLTFIAFAWQEGIKDIASNTNIKVEIKLRLNFIKQEVRPHVQLPTFAIVNKTANCQNYKFTPNPIPNESHNEHGISNELHDNFAEIASHHAKRGKKNFCMSFYFVALNRGVLWYQLSIRPVRGVITTFVPIRVQKRKRENMLDDIFYG